ncbi:AMP-dependent synthetase [Pseudonocardia sulfidoxydans NBRC 16205]|uniref:AMP-dependent synthetase n=2 Tax=Pseudonocardia sulfidoxydans TaxID=54011 RepID=A0A511DMF6_9PSEU|nr:AMP-binding protein [Pseudonocardia sulfidoxydans]GEL25567.1 AMP-dependent synthetase [Pseudonocardia sulfidoxydans NBRC 16205]
MTTVPDLLDRRAVDSPDQGVAFPDARMTYPELAAASRDAARALHALGVRAGDSVGLLLPGRLDSVLWWLAAARIGAVTVPVNVRLKARELAYMIENADMTVLLAAAELAPVLDEALPDGAAPQLRAIVSLDDDTPPGWMPRADLEAVLSTEADVATAQSAIDPADPVVMLYTSGTTSRPRGCLHSHASLVEEGEAVTERLGLRPDDRFWTPLPMFHCGGFDVAMSALAGRCGMVHVGTFEPGRALAQLAGERCTVGFPAFDTIWVPVLDHPAFPDTDLSALRMVLNVGSPERMRSMQARLPHVVQMSCTGSTESFGFCCMGSPDDPADVRATTCGRPLRHMQARVVDPDTGVDVPAGTPGEFRFRGGSRFLRYHRDDALTAERIDVDGWFSSGDLVVADAEGRVAFVSRLKDMLKVGGENVAAAELEGFLGEHPAVGLVQVVAAPDAHYGEVPAAFVQLRAGAEATEDELIAFCRGTIAGFKVPRYVRFVDEWPMSGTKVQKFRLRDRLAAELAAGGVTGPHVPPPRDPRLTPGKLTANSSEATVQSQPGVPSTGR